MLDAEVHVVVQVDRCQMLFRFSVGRGLMLDSMLDLVLGLVLGLMLGLMLDIMLD